MTELPNLLRTFSLRGKKKKIEIVWEIFIGTDESLPSKTHI